MLKLNSGIPIKIWLRDRLFIPVSCWVPQKQTLRRRFWITILIIGRIHLSLFTTFSKTFLANCILYFTKCILVVCPTLCNPTVCSTPGSSIHEILQTRILEWVAMSFSRGLPNPGMEPFFLTSPALAGRFFTGA